MTVLISHMTAVDFWRKIYPAGKTPGRAARDIPRESLSCTAGDIWCEMPEWVTPTFLQPENGTAHVTVCNPNDRRVSKTHRCHLWRSDFPKGSFYQLNDEVYIASPAFAFLQLGTVASLAQLVAYGNELCGLYSFDDARENGVRQRSTPLVTVNQLADFVAGARGAHGRAAAEKALGLIVQNAASPQETTVEMLQCLPYRYGGYGLPAPSMNRKIPLSAEAANIARRAHLVADFSWPDRKIDQEFHGERNHSGTTALHSDRARTNALESMGYTVIEITSQEVRNFAAFESITLRLAGMLGKRIAREYRGALPQRIELREQLFSWNRASGRCAP